MNEIHVEQREIEQIQCKRDSETEGERQRARGSGSGNGGQGSACAAAVLTEHFVLLWQTEWRQ